MLDSDKYEALSNFAFNFKLRRYSPVPSAGDWDGDGRSDIMVGNAEGRLMVHRNVVGRCGLTVSKPGLKAPMVSALERTL